MARRLSFRARIFWSFLLIIVVALVLPAWYSQHLLGRELSRAARIGAEGQVALLAGQLEQDERLSDRQTLTAWLSHAATSLNVHLAYRSASGELLFDLAGPGARSASGGAPDGIVVSREVTPAGDLPAGSLTLTRSFEALSQDSVALVGNVLLGVLLTFLLAVPLCYLLSRQLAASLTGMASLAEAIGNGDYGRRLLALPGREFITLAGAINRMAESIQAQIETITAQKEQLEAVLDGMKEGVLVLDDTGRIRSFNRAMLAIFPGVAAAVGKKPLEAVMDASLQQACDKALASRESGGAKLHALQIEPEKGRIYDVGIVSLSHGHSGLGAVVVFHDISELKHLERVRRDFVANVSHELRTPLTSIKGYAETLMDTAGGDPAKARGFIEVILKNANHMSKIVGDLLNLSRLEAGKQLITPAPMDAAAALSAAYRECLPLAEAKAVSLDNRLPAEGLYVVADHDRLVQVFRNLIENAIKYSQSDCPIRVFHQVHGAEAWIGLSDCGPGIPKEERQKIFERFYRVERHRDKAPGSSGLGLAIVKHIVEKHGGRVWVESPAAGQETGATFFFSLPLAKRHENDTDVPQG